MKKLLALLCGVLLTVTITGCSSSEDNSKYSDLKPRKVADAATKPKKEESGINTSVFGYAKSVDVTDGRDVMKHLDLVVHVDAQSTPGVAVQAVITQTYDFLQQADIKGADTITVGIMRGEFRITQFTVDVKKFKAGENLIKSVLSASKIDKMNDEVKEYGKTMNNLW